MTHGPRLPRNITARERDELEQAVLAIIDRFKIAPSTLGRLAQIMVKRRGGE